MPSLFLLDTNAWIRLFARPGEIRPEVRRTLNNEQVLGLSPMSIVEVAQKAQKGRLLFSLPLDEWVANALPPDRLQLMSLTPEIALQSYRWPADFHGDPADRIIAATAKVHQMTLVTSDALLLGRPDLPTLATC